MTFCKTIIAAALLTAASQQIFASEYTGRFRIDHGTEYVALEEPSQIGGACSGWKAVEIRDPNNRSGWSTKKVICWKHDGENIVITGKTGEKKTPGPAKLWKD